MPPPWPGVAFPFFSRMHMLAKSLRFFLIVSVCLVAPVLAAGCTPHDDALAAQQTAGPGEYLFCHWNVENFFDDKHDNRHHKADKEFDSWFSSNPKIFQE